MALALPEHLTQLNARADGLMAVYGTGGDAQQALQ